MGFGAEGGAAVRARTGLTGSVRSGAGRLRRGAERDRLLFGKLVDISH